MLRTPTLLSLFVVLLMATPVVAGVILWDDAHDTDGDALDGAYSQFRDAILGAGHEWVELTPPSLITDAVLAGVDAVVILDAETPYTDAEIASLQQFVSNGGGLFVIFDAGHDLVSSAQMLLPYGLEFEGTLGFGSGLTVTTFVDHPVTTAVAGVNIDFGTTIVTFGSGVPLVAGGEPVILAAAAGSDRVVVFGDSATFANPTGSDSSIADLDNLTLTLNVMSYITGGGATRILRGDCDGSGRFVGLIDALAALNFQFVAGVPAPACLAQCDADGSGTFSGLVDGIYMLNFQFAPGSPPIPAPFPNCGIEPSGFNSIDSVGCNAVSCP